MSEFEVPDGERRVGVTIDAEESRRDGRSDDRGGMRGKRREVKERGQGEGDRQMERQCRQTGAVAALCGADQADGRAEQRSIVLGIGGPAETDSGNDEREDGNPSLGVKGSPLHDGRVDGVPAR